MNEKQSHTAGPWKLMTVSERLIELCKIWSFPHVTKLPICQLCMKYPVTTQLDKICHRCNGNTF